MRAAMGNSQRAWAAVLGVLALAACSPQAVTASDGDVAVDAVVAETLVDAEVDGTDSLPDTVADVPDAVDTADSSDTADVPYWIAHDIDIAGLGVITSSGFCSDVYLQVKPGDPPEGPTCASACPAPYPCTCGTCPWVETPLMNVPRYGAAAIWTGEEVLVFGGTTSTGNGAPPYIFTAERWNPSSDKGFEMIDLPFTSTSSWAKAFWTGTEAVVIQDDLEFRFDPKTNLVTEMPLAPVYRTPHGAIVWTGEMLVWWGGDRATMNGPVHAAHLAGWRPTTGWQDLPFPSTYLQSSYGEEPYCMTALDSQIYVFDPRGPRNPASGLDPAKPVMLRYDPATTAWTALPQTMVSDIHCTAVYDAQPIMFQAFPDGIALIPAIGPYADSPDLPAVGEIWWKVSGQWTATKPPPLTGPFSNTPAPAWTGSQFAIAGVLFEDPVTTGKLLPDASGVDGPTWPVRYDPYTDEFSYLTSVGYPKHYRLSSARVFTGKELLVLGGSNGITETTMHRDGVRLWLAEP